MIHIIIHLTFSNGAAGSQGFPPYAWTLDTPPPTVFESDRFSGGMKHLLRRHSYEASFNRMHVLL